MDLVKQIKKQNIAIMGNPTWMAMSGVLCFGKWEVVQDPSMTACTDGKNVKYTIEEMEEIQQVFVHIDPV